MPAHTKGPMGADAMPGPWLTALLATQMTTSPPGGSTSDPSRGHCRSAWHAKSPMESEDRQEGRNGKLEAGDRAANARGNELSGSRPLEMSGKPVPGKWAVGPGEARLGWGFVEVRSHRHGGLSGSRTGAHPEVPQHLRGRRGRDPGT